MTPIYTFLDICHCFNTIDLCGVLLLVSVDVSVQLHIASIAIDTGQAPKILLITALQVPKLPLGPALLPLESGFLPLEGPGMFHMCA